MPKSKNEWMSNDQITPKIALQNKIHETVLWVKDGDISMWLDSRPPLKKKMLLFTLTQDSQGHIYIRFADKKAALIWGPAQEQEIASNDPHTRSAVRIMVLRDHIFGLLQYHHIVRVSDDGQRVSIYGFPLSVSKLNKILKTGTFPTKSSSIRNELIKRVGHLHI